MIRRAVAPMDGVKGGLRSSRSSRGRRGVQGLPRPVSFSRCDERPAPTYGWGMWAFTIGWTVFMVTVAKLGGAL